MKQHYHTGIEPLFVTSLAIPLLWHGYRWIAAKAAQSDGVLGSIGEAIGGFFTFGGLS